ncbi:MAG: hypothetical protein ACUVT2_00370 [Thiobacillaceae bacterium]
MSKSGSSRRDQDPPPLLKGDLAHLLAGLERQREDLGPIADELIDLLRKQEVNPPKPTVYPA